MNVYITKYALTGGIIQDRVEKWNDGIMASLTNDNVLYYTEGREWHDTKESAIAHAEEMRTQKIASLKKQIARLEKLDFNNVVEGN